MKVLNSGDLSPFGGLNFVIEEFDRLGVGAVLESHLPELPPQRHYGWRDLLYSFWSVFFCGGDCIEDLGINLRGSLEQNPFLKTPSPDTVLRRMKQLAVPSQIFQAPRGKVGHEFSINDRLNLLNLKLSKDRISKQKGPLVLDYDNTLIFSKKMDAKMTYKKQPGYAPGVAMVGNNIVYVENRNGNSAAANLQEDTLERMFSLLAGQQISVDVFRADAGSYKLSTLAVVNEHVDRFYIRAGMNHSLNEAIQKVTCWKSIDIDGKEAFRGSTLFTPFKNTAKRENKGHLLREYRVVITKQQRDDLQANLFSGEAYNYYAIITNELEMSDDQVVFFYNQRGALEKEFDILKNDFGWDNMPFSKMEQNNVFLILTAICRNLYAGIIGSFSERFKGLLPAYRMKKFIFRFITVPAKWVYRSRQWQLKLYGSLSFKT